MYLTSNIAEHSDDIISSTVVINSIIDNIIGNQEIFLWTFLGLKFSNIIETEYNFLLNYVPKDRERITAYDKKSFQDQTKKIIP